MRCSTLRTSGCIRPRAKGAIAPLPLLELGDQPIDSPREGCHLALPKLASEAAAPLLIGGPELVHQRPPAARELHARGAKVLRIIVTLGQAELLQPRDH